MKIKHGLSKRTAKGGRIDSPEWRIYNAMKTRCLNPNFSRYPDYGGRGIKICSRWLKGDGEKSGVQCFIDDVGHRPSKAHSLNRKDNDGPYSPENCEWATIKEQNRNSRNNRIVSIKGEKMILIEAVEKFSSVRYATVVQRLYRGWNEEDAILRP